MLLCLRNSEKLALFWNFPFVRLSNLCCVVRAIVPKTVLLECFYKSSKSESFAADNNKNERILAFFISPLPKNACFTTALLGMKQECLLYCRRLLAWLKKNACFTTASLGMKLWRGWRQHTIRLLLYCSFEGTCFTTALQGMKQFSKSRG